MARAADASGLLRAEDFRHYVDALNRSDPEDVNGGISNAEAWAWMTRNVPYLACPDSGLELTYYYRWWAYRKHIEKTGAGYVITEFLRSVKHSTDYNAISCALGLHIAEGRWLHDARYLDGYVDFWLHSGEGGGLQEHFHQFSGWLADALYDRWLADGNRPRLLAQCEEPAPHHQQLHVRQCARAGRYRRHGGGRQRARRIRAQGRRAPQADAGTLLESQRPVLRDRTGGWKVRQRARADRLHPLVFRSAREGQGLRSRVATAHGPARLLRSVRPHHGGTAPPRIRYRGPGRRLPVERPELALRYQHHAARAGQRAERLCAEFGVRQ